MNTLAASPTFSGFMDSGGIFAFVVVCIAVVLALFWLFMPMILWSELRLIRKELVKLNAKR